jgi:DNA-binding transcriptional LysR family regulator
MKRQSTIDIKKLRHIVELARFRNVTRAAETLGLTQSALSRSIQEIEAELGKALFTRHSKGVSITDMGNDIARRAEELLESYEDLLTTPERSTRAMFRHLKIGVIPASYQGLIRKPVASFAAEFPEVSIRIQTGSSDELTAKLETGQLDVLVGYGNWLRRWESVFIVRTVAEMHQAILVRKDHPLSRLEKVSDNDIMVYPCILPSSMYSDHNEIYDVFQENLGRSRPQRYHTDDFQTMLAIVNKTDAFLPLVQASSSFEKLKDNFLILPDIEILPRQDLVVARLSNSRKNELLTKFVTRLERFLQTP